MPLKPPKKNFNSHPHEEDDSSVTAGTVTAGISTHILTKRMTFGEALTGGYINISTHILTKRMTALEDEITELNGISTHILTKRMTSFPDQESQTPLYFNSHPHEEDDNEFEKRLKEYKNFNSHPHEEDD